MASANQQPGRYSRGGGPLPGSKKEITGVHVINCNNEQAWLAERSKTIGASEVPTIMGRGLAMAGDPFELYCRKKGLVQDERKQSDEARDLGVVMEPVIAKLYEKATRRAVFRDSPFSIVRNPQWPWLSATLDARTIGIRHAAGPGAYNTDGALELKNYHWIWQKEWDIGVPIVHQIQLMVQILLREYTWGSVAALLGGQMFRYGDVERNDKFIDAMLVKTREFYDRLQNDDPPAPSGTEQTKKLLSQLHKQATTEEAVVLPEEADGWHDDLEDAIAAEKAAQKRRRECENLIKHAMGKASRSVFIDGETAYVWKNTVKNFKAVEAKPACQTKQRRFGCSKITTVRRNK